MIQEARDTLMRTIGEIEGLTVLPYLGQLSDPQKPDIGSHTLPAVLVDFVGDEGEGETVILHFNLYITHVTYSSHETYRKESHAEVYGLLEQISNRLRHITQMSVFPKQSKKIFDNHTAKGYLTIFTRAVDVHILDEGVSTWHLE